MAARDILNKLQKDRKRNIETRQVKENTGEKKKMEIDKRNTTVEQKEDKNKEENKVGKEDTNHIEDTEVSEIEEQPEEETRTTEEITLTTMWERREEEEIQKEIEEQEIVEENRKINEEISDKLQIKYRGEPIVNIDIKEDTYEYDRKKDIQNVGKLREIENVITKLETLEERVQEQKCIKEWTKGRLSTTELEKFKIGKEDMIYIQVIDSRGNKNKNRKGKKEITFYFRQREKGETEDHIYHNNKIFWNSEWDKWDIEGKYYEVRKEEKKIHTPKPEVKINLSQYPLKIFIADTIVTSVGTEELKKFIENIEEGKRNVSVYLGITKRNIRHHKHLGYLKKKFSGINRIDDRLKTYKNLQTYKTILENENITHVIDNREGYLRKALITRDFIRKTILIAPKDNRKLIHPDIQRLEKWEEVGKRIKEWKQHGGTESFILQPIEGTSNRGKQIEKGGIHRFVEWNTNSLRNVERNGYLEDFIKRHGADHIFITECKGTAEDILLIGKIKKILDQEYRYKYFNHAKKNKGQYGTAFFSKYEPKYVLKDMNKTDEEGRIITVVYEYFCVVVSYTPTLRFDKVTGQLDRVERREKFDEDLRKHIRTIKDKYQVPVILTGDLNCCILREDIWDSRLIDTPFPSSSKEERERISNIMIENHLTDSYGKGSEDQENETRMRDRWTFFYNDRKNKGMRLDYFLIPKEWIGHSHTEKPKLIRSGISRNQRGSDHLPVFVDIEFPQTYTFRCQEGRRKDKNPQQEHFERNINNTEIDEEEEMDPFSFRGIHMRSPVFKFMEDIKSQEEMLNYVKTLVTKYEEAKKEEEEERQEYLNRIEEREANEHKWIPYIKIGFHKYGEEACMIDTGANSNIITIQQLRRIMGEDVDKKLIPSRAYIRVGDTQRVDILGKYRLEFFIDGVRFAENFLVMKEANFDILLGSTFFHKHKSDILYSSLKFRCKKNKKEVEVDITKKPEEELKKYGYSQNLLETVVLPPNTKRYVTTVLPKSINKLFENQFGSVERSDKLMIKKGVLASAGFGYMSREGLMNIEIMNVSGEEIEITKNSEISRFVPMTETQYCTQGEGFEWDEDKERKEEIHVTNMKEDMKTGTQDNRLEVDTAYIPKKEDIPDYSKEEIDKMFLEAPLKQLLENLKVGDMSVPGTPTEEQMDRLKQFIAKRSSVWTKDESKPQKIKNYQVHIQVKGKPVHYKKWKFYLGAYCST